MQGTVCNCAHLWPIDCVLFQRNFRRKWWQLLAIVHNCGQVSSTLRNRFWEPPFRPFPDYLAIPEVSRVRFRDLPTLEFRPKVSRNSSRWIRATLLRATQLTHKELPRSASEGESLLKLSTFRRGSESHAWGGVLENTVLVAYLVDKTRARETSGSNSTRTPSY